MAFREIGRARDAILTFTAIMNTPSPMNKCNYDALNNKLYDAYKVAADKSKNNAGLEVRKIIKNDCNKDDVINCSVSIDQSWQHGGFSLLKGVVVATCHDNTKVIDTIVLSKFCKTCQVWGEKGNS